MVKRGRKRPVEDASEGEDGSVEQSKDEDMAEQEEDPDADDDSNNDDEEDGDDNNNLEEEEDGGEMEERNGDDEDEEEAEPIRRHVNREGKPAEAGVIKSVYIENFMCHKKLTVNLCRNINFINGQNGSGKSAILAAIQICLGASATRTHRAKNLKDLIRKESTNSNPVTSAKLVVTVLNGGGDGYKPDVYGDAISVVRCISKNGGYNGYKLMDANGVEQSRSKKDLDDMLDHLNIQVDNPVAILDQEDAKRFLQGKASDKYGFFVKATELERIDKKYASAADRALELKANKDKLTDTLDAKRELVITLKKKYEEHQLLEKLEKKLMEHHVDYAWAFYQERNNDYEEVKQKMDQFTEKAKKKQEELSQAEEEANGAEGGDEENFCRARMEELRQEAESQAQLKHQLEADYKMAKNPVKAKERELNSAKDTKKQYEKELKRARNTLKDARDEIVRQAGSAESDAARRTEILQRAEADLAAAKEQVNAKKQSVATSLRDYEELEPAVEQAKSHTATKASHLNGCKIKLKDLRESAGNSLAMFGPKCEQVYRLVEKATKAGKFNGPVLGPIGSFIKIAEGKEQYAQMAELALGFNTLDRFVVTTDHDRKLFMNLRKQARCQKDCAVFQVVPSARFTVPPPPQDIETVASVLTISNDIIFNALVDVARIDQRALARSREISEQQLLMKDQNGRYKIKGIINEVYFLPQGDKWSVRDGSLALTSNGNQLRRSIGVDKTAAIEEAQKEAMQLEAELKDLKQTEAKLASEQKDAQRKWNMAKKADLENRLAIKKLSDKIEDVRQEMENTANVTIDTTDLEEDVAEAERNVDEADGIVEQLQQEIEAAQPGMEEIKARKDEVAARTEKVLSDMNNAEEELQKILHTQTQREEIVEKKRKKLEKLEEVVKKHKENIDSHKAERDQALLRARKLSLRQDMKEKQAEDEENDENMPPSQVNFTEEELENAPIREVDHDPKHYEAKINRGKAKIEKERDKRQLGTKDDPAIAYENYMRAKTKLDEMNNAIEDINGKVEHLNKDMRKRRKRWSELQKHLARYTDSKFDQILNLNKNSGTLEFDHDQGELNLIVQKDINDVNSQTKDVKALSGGERSFTTLSLLLALGESLETPFRVLDEFDVFLDTQARKLAIKTLIFIAKKMQHRQFIFITPQDLSSVTPDELLKIFKLKAPDRNQFAGGPSQQTLNFSSQAD